jgi:hypothetical protein
VQRASFHEDGSGFDIDTSGIEFRTFNRAAMTEAEDHGTREATMTDGAAVCCKVCIDNRENDFDFLLSAEDGGMG